MDRENKIIIIESYPIFISILKHIIVGCSVNSLKKKKVQNMSNLNERKEFVECL